MHSDRPRTYDVQYCGSDIYLTPMTEIKICGIWYCNDPERSFKLKIWEAVTNSTATVELKK